MRRAKVALGAAMVTALLGSSSALASGTHAGGKIKLFVANPDALKSAVLVTGAIGDYGTAISQDKSGKPEINGNYEKLTLKHGGFTIDGSSVRKEFEKAKPTLNRSNCSVQVSGSAITPVIDGTGSYTGISGKLKLSFDIGFIAPRKRGKCDFSENAKSVAQQSIFSAAGTITFS
jgi:hypothetical protein